MSVRGSVGTMSFEDLLGWIRIREPSGVLRAERGTHNRVFHFDCGAITHTSSNISREQLGRMLIFRGLITEAQLNQAFRAQEDTGVMLGKILLMIDALTETTLRAVLEEKVHTSVFEASAWRQGSFVFEPQAPEPVSAFEISISVGDALDHVATRRAEWDAIRRLVPSDDALLVIGDVLEIVSGDEDAESRQARQLLVSMLPHRHTVTELVEVYPADRFTIARHLAALVARGAIKVLPPLQPANHSVSLAEDARKLAEAGERSRALVLVRKALDGDPENVELKTLCNELEHSVAAALTRELLVGYSVPSVLMTADELAEIDLTQEERYLVERVDGCWDLLTLVRISSLRQVDALMMFKSLSERGILAL